MNPVFDRHMMQVALRMAKRGLGASAPNPAVGAVIADETAGEVIARGWTQPGGRPHAETEAISRAGAHARGATLYVTLEPCSHQGKTGPCANAIIDAGVRRVVVAIEDPDARVSGCGLTRMRDAGILVETGLLAAEARWLTLGHVLRVTRHRPFVQLKLALSADGSVPRGGEGQPTWVTSPEARAHAALLRAEADAILVGAGTVADDDPQLTCRLPGLDARSPIRVVLSSRLDLPRNAKVFTTARQIPTWVIATDRADPGHLSALEEMGVAVLDVRQRDGGAGKLEGVLETLAEKGITRLLVEGGPRMWRAFSDAGVVDEVVVYQARGDGSDVSGVAGVFVNLDGMTLAARLKLARDDVAVFRAKR